MKYGYGDLPRFAKASEGVEARLGRNLLQGEGVAGGHQADHGRRSQILKPQKRVADSNSG
jgi:hypothetical protein